HRRRGLGRGREALGLVYRAGLQLLRFNILLPSPFRSQPHTWPPAIGEFDTSGFRHSAYGCHCLSIARIPTGLDLGDNVAVEASFFRELLNGPIKQATRGPNLRRCHGQPRSLQEGVRHRTNIFGSPIGPFATQAALGPEVSRCSPFGRARMASDYVPQPRWWIIFVIAGCIAL